VDKFELEDHSTVHMMKIRAAHQGSNSSVYMVTIPKGVFHEKANTNIPQYIVDLIDKHKKRI
jgi:hypothetical protein